MECSSTSHRYRKICTSGSSADRVRVRVCRVRVRGGVLKLSFVYQDEAARSAGVRVRVKVKGYSKNNVLIYVVTEVNACRGQG